MSSFTGVSVITDGKRCTTFAVNAGTYKGYHLLLVKDYSRTVQEIANREEISSGPFMVGGHKWSIRYCPNGHSQSSADSISVYICLEDVGTEEAVKVRCAFSFADEFEYQKPMRLHASEPQSLSSEDPYYGCVEFVERDALERSAHLKDDCFTVRCDILVCKDHDTQDVSDIGQHLDILLENKVGADVTFEVSGETFAAHRCVLAARSKVFMAQLFGPMAEGTTSSVIHIKDMKAKVFADLLSFIYTDSFPEMEEDGAQAVEAVEDELPEVEESGQEEETMWLQDLLVAADRYELQKLKLLCEENLSEDISVSSVASTLALAEQHYCHGLKEACLKFIKVQSVPCLEKIMATDGWEHIMTTHPSVVKEIIAEVASSQTDKKRKR
ncbi:unnamed protein product [Alopecurus aequalis]